jgi:hypothetical protein
MRRWQWQNGHEIVTTSIGSAGKLQPMG